MCVKLPSARSVVPSFKFTLVVEPLAPEAVNEPTEFVAVARLALTVPEFVSVKLKAPPVSPALAVCEIALPAPEAVRPIALLPAFIASENAIELPLNVSEPTLVEPVAVVIAPAVTLRLVPEENVFN